MKSNFKFIPENLRILLRKTSFYKKRAIKNKYIVKCSDAEIILDEAPPLFLKEPLLKKPKVAIIKTHNYYNVKGYVNPKASWLRYERFCKNNNIPYGFYDITKNNWIEEAKQFDIFICHTESNPSYQDMIESKFYILEKILGKSCFPSYHELWQYENKIRSNYLYQCFDLPSIPTKITYNKEEALELVKEVSYPFITKTTIGAGSTGVKKISKKHSAISITKKIFGYYGLKTQYPYQRQKDYIYIQNFIEDATYDLRIMLIGDKAFGYYRYPKRGDYRASGSGIVEKKDLPKEAICLAVDIRNKLNSRLLGVDLLFSGRHSRYLIIETSLFNQIDTPEQLVIEGVPGYYDVSDINNITFKEGRFWIHELIMQDLLSSGNNK